MPDEITREIIETESVAEDVDEVAEQLAAHDLISEERHEQIIEEVSQCQQKLDQLSTLVQTTVSSETAESPILAQILTTVTDLRAEMETLKNELQSLKSSQAMKPPNPPTLSESTPEPMEPAEPNLVESTEEQKPEEPEPEAPKPVRKKFRLL